MSRELKQNSKGGHFGYEVNNLLNEKEIYLSKQDIFNIAKYAIEKHIVIVTLSKEWEDIQNSYTDNEDIEAIKAQKEALEQEPTKFIVEVKDLGNELEISNPKYSNKVTIDYNNDETYFKNILSLFPNFGIIQFRNMEGFDLIELAELKRS